ncbi:hypothetical protein HYU14_06935 [Candidatus Woesearchaeota archaeon]|nr:hypothetical protein [Candidatus Woesearchaeota archaeon]
MGEETIRAVIWNLIDRDIALRKILARGIINIRGLAKSLIKEQKLDASLDSVISAVRRYKEHLPKKAEQLSAYAMLKEAKVSIKTKMAMLLLKRADEVKTSLGRPEKIADYQLHDTIRILEGYNTFTLIVDRKNMDKVKGLFSPKNILSQNNKVGMIEISYPPELEKTPGVFAVISGELGQNDISINAALIAPREHIIIVDEDKLLKAFEVIFGLAGSK